MEAIDSDQPDRRPRAAPHDTVARRRRATTVLARHPGDGQGSWTFRGHVGSGRRVSGTGR